MTWWIWLILVIYFGCNLFVAIWLSRTSRGATTYVNNPVLFTSVFLFGGLAGIIILVSDGIKWIIKCLKRKN